MANGVGLRFQSLRGSWVRIPPPAPYPHESESPYVRRECRAAWHEGRNQGSLRLRVAPRQRREATGRVRVNLRRRRDNQESCPLVYLRASKNTRSRRPQAPHLLSSGKLGPFL